MLKAMEEGYGRKKSIPQMIMAGASVDDVFVIVLFTAFTGLARTGTLDPRAFLAIPTSILLGLLGGIGAGLLLTLLFRRFHIRDTGKTLILLSLAFLLLSLEEALSGTLAFSGLLAVMAMGATLQQGNYEAARRLSGKFSKLFSQSDPNRRGGLRNENLVVSLKLRNYIPEFHPLGNSSHWAYGRALSTIDTIRRSYWGS